MERAFSNSVTEIKLSDTEIDRRNWLERYEDRMNKLELTTDELIDTRNRKEVAMADATRVSCNYPNCDGGSSTGYCHTDCRPDTRVDDEAVAELAEKLATLAAREAHNLVGSAVWSTGQVRHLAQSFRFELASLTRQLAEARAERDRMAWALKVFAVHSIYPVAQQIDARGYKWRGEDSLDYAKELADAALSPPREGEP